MKKLRLSYVTIALFLFAAVLFFKGFMTSKKNASEDAEKQTVAYKQHCEFNRQINEKYGNVVVKNVKCRNSENQVMELENIVDGAPVLVFRFSGFHCTGCYTEQLEFLKTLDEVKFIVLATFATEREMQLYTKTFKPHYPFFLIKENGLAIPVEEIGFPYYFLLQPDFSASDFYIPQSDLPFAREEFFKQFGYKMK